MPISSPPEGPFYIHSDADFLRSYFSMKQRTAAFSFRDAVRASRGDPVSAAKLLETITLELSDDDAAIATELNAIIESTNYLKEKS